MMKEKSIVDDIDRSVYDIRDEEHDSYRMEAGALLRRCALGTKYK